MAIPRLLFHGQADSFVIVPRNFGTSNLAVSLLIVTRISPGWSAATTSTARLSNLRLARTGAAFSPPSWADEAETPRSAIRTGMLQRMTSLLFGPSVNTRHANRRSLVEQARRTVTVR